uniref:hypothetical protein n=1 Tax=Streptomyces tubercidicus TaxID=47759 RepID=UPI0037DC750E|nr:hypothetical protein OG690_38160 [Streptomyces tubercidicus]
MTSHADPSTPREYTESMIRSAIEADRLVQERINDRYLREAHTHTAVNGFIAAMAMECLRRFAPDSANDLAEHLTRVLASGDLEGTAYRTAKGLNFDPDQWIAEFNERAALRKANTQ